MPKRELEFLLVEWVDSYGDVRWTDWDEAAKIKVSTNETVGFLVSETDDVLYIGASFDRDHDNVSGLTIIPKVAITKRSHLMPSDPGSGHPPRRRPSKRVAPKRPTPKAPRRMPKK